MDIIRIYFRTSYDLECLLKKTKLELHKEELQKILQRDTKKIITIKKENATINITISELFSNKIQSAKEYRKFKTFHNIKAYTYPQNNKEIKKVLEEIQQKQKITQYIQYIYSNT